MFKNYIAKNLCINKNKKGSCCEGKCFLEKQIKLTNENSNASENNNNKKNTNNDVKEFLGSYDLSPKPMEIILFLLVNTAAIEIKEFVSAIFKPPKLNPFFNFRHLIRLLNRMIN